MKIITFNANGIRSASSKGFFTWLAKQDADIVCIQETKAHQDQLNEVFYPKGYHCIYSDAAKRGYSGTALFSRVKPNSVDYGFGFPQGDLFEGRYVQANFDNISVASLYLPSGSSKESRQLFKYQMMDAFYAHLERCKALAQEFVFCADWNICHQERDLKNWRGNMKNSGFLPEERAWLDRVYDELGYADSFRCLEQADDEYSWWSNRGQAWAKNVGWRLDYQIVSPKIAGKTIGSEIYREQRFSDHAPVIMEYDFSIDDRAQSV